MPVKITLFAENVVRGTALVEHAIAEGLSLGEFVEVEAPIKIRIPKALKVAPVVKRKRGHRVFHTSPHATYNWHRRKNDATKGSAKDIAHKAVNAKHAKFPKTRRETIDLLTLADLTASRCKATFTYLVEKGVLQL